MCTAIVCLPPALLRSVLSGWSHRAAQHCTSMIKPVERAKKFFLYSVQWLFRLCLMMLKLNEIKISLRKHPVSHSPVNFFKNSGGYLFEKTIPYVLSGFRQLWNQSK